MMYEYFHIRLMVSYMGASKVKQYELKYIKSKSPLLWWGWKEQPDFPSHFQIFQPFPANARPPWMFLPRLVEETGHVTEVDVAGNLVYIDIYDVGIEKKQLYISSIYVHI